MRRYLWIQSNDLSGSPEAADDVALLERLAASGAAVELLLVQNAVLSARAAAADTGLERLARAGVAVAAEELSLRERGIAAPDLRRGVTPCSLELVIAAMAAGDHEVGEEQVVPAHADHPRPARRGPRSLARGFGSPRPGARGTVHCKLPCGSSGHGEVRSWLIYPPFSTKMELMPYIPRGIEADLHAALARGKSVLLLGPRQTGKTTLLERLDSPLRVSLVDPCVRQRYERDPAQLVGEVEALGSGRKPPLVVLDEVQKVPELLDAAQDLIDRRRAQFILCGSSARKLRRGGANLLPGRVVTLRLDPLSLTELSKPTLDDLLLYGSLPGIETTADSGDRERDLDSYVRTYLEEEVRAESLARSLGAFARFLELAALESGRLVSFRALSQEVGVSHTTISSYYEILEDCLVAERVDPLTTSRTRKKLTRSSRWLLFDLGVRRLAAREGTRLSPERMGELYEQFVGLELVRLARRRGPASKILFWRDPDGPEVDWIYSAGRALVPVEVKWTDRPSPRDVRHLDTFLAEYPQARHAFVVCRAPRRQRLAPRVTALPWRELEAVAMED